MVSINTELQDRCFLRAIEAAELVLVGEHTAGVAFVSFPDGQNAWESPNRTYYVTRPLPTDALRVVGCDERTSLCFRYMTDGSIEERVSEDCPFEATQFLGRTVVRTTVSREQTTRPGGSA